MYPDLGGMESKPGPHLLLVRYRPGGPPAEGANVAQLATAVALLLGVVHEDPDDGVQDTIHSLNCNEVWKGGALIDSHLHMDDVVVCIGEEGVAAAHSVRQDNGAKAGMRAVSRSTGTSGWTSVSLTCRRESVVGQP